MSHEEELNLDGLEGAVGGVEDDTPGPIDHTERDLLLAWEAVDW